MNNKVEMPNYTKGQIYMLEPKCEYEEGDIYYGSTTQILTKRLFQHKQKSNPCISSILIEKYGDIKIVLVKLVSCNSRQELVAEEAKYIRENKCINKNIPLRTHKEWLETNKEVNKEVEKKWRENNKEKVKEHYKEWYENNKEKNKENNKEWKKNNKEKVKEINKKCYEENKDKRKKYNQKNKDKIAEKTKKYYEENKDKIAERQKETIECPICKCETNKHHLKRHQLSIKCKSFNRHPYP